jgi:glycine/D-amino acid oxidase-like deaminating enzyme
MGPPIDPCPVSESLPKAVGAVVIGGGIIGLCTALSLIQAGLTVAIVEKGRIAAEQSSRNWGWVRRMGRDPRELPLITEAMRLWDGMAETLGCDVGFRRSGILYLCESEADVAHHEGWLAAAGDHAGDTRIIRGDALRALLPGATRDFPAALWTASDARAEPQRAGPAIATAIHAAGGHLLENCAVLEIETSAGHISGVQTEKGHVACSHVVVAGGVWSSQILRPLGLRLPQLGVRSSVLRTGPIDGGPKCAAWGPRFAWRKRADGGYTVADGGPKNHDLVRDSFRYLADFIPILKMEWRSVRLGMGRSLIRGPSAGPGDPLTTRIMDPAPAVRSLDRTLAALAEVFPVFAGAPVLQYWSGMIDATPDAIPVISAVPTHPGLVVASGFSGHGFGIAPGAGRLAADIVLGRAPVVDIRPFRLGRFSDGTRHKPTTGV